MISESDVAQQLKDAKKKLTGLAPDLLGKHPIAEFIHEVQRARGWQRYYYVSPKLQKIMSEILSGYALHVMAAYHKCVLLSLILDSLAGLRKQTFPEAIKGFYSDWFGRVVKDLSSQPDEYYDAEAFAFLQDLAVCSLRAIPVGGAWFVEISRAKEWMEERESRGIKTGLSIKVSQIGLVKMHLRQYIVPLLYRLGFFEFYYQVHTFSRYLPRFTTEEMEKTYMHIAQLLRQNRRIKGLFRRSWFLDPELEKISPELTYLRKVPEQNGAIFFPCLTLQRNIDNALAFSPKRRKWHAEGKYMPACFAYIWPRKELLEWAEKKAKS
jgi:hypothetical protein